MSSVIKDRRRTSQVKRTMIVGQDNGEAGWRRNLVASGNGGVEFKLVDLQYQVPIAAEFNGGRGSCDCSIPGDDPRAGKDDLTIGKVVIVYDRSVVPL